MTNPKYPLNNAPNILPPFSDRTKTKHLKRETLILFVFSEIDSGVGCFQCGPPYYYIEPSANLAFSNAVTLQISSLY